MHLLLPPTSPLQWEEGRKEVPKLTCLREQVQPSASLVLLCRGGYTPELPPAAALSTDVCDGGQEKLPPHPCTGHENGVHWSHPSVDVGAPPQAASTGSVQLLGERWLERGFCWGQAPWGPLCAALRAPPAALVPGRAGGQLSWG